MGTHRVLPSMRPADRLIAVLLAILLTVPLIALAGIPGDRVRRRSQGVVVLIRSDRHAADGRLGVHGQDQRAGSERTRDRHYRGQQTSLSSTLADSPKSHLPSARSAGSMASVPCR